MNGLSVCAVAAWIAVQAFVAWQAWGIVAIFAELAPEAVAWARGCAILLSSLAVASAVGLPVVLLREGRAG